MEKDKILESKSEINNANINLTLYALNSLHKLQLPQKKFKNSKNLSPKKLYLNIYNNLNIFL